MNDPKQAAIKRQVVQVREGLYARTISGREYKAFVAAQKDAVGTDEEKSVSNVYQLVKHAASDEYGRALFESVDQAEELPIDAARAVFEAAAVLNGLKTADSNAGN